VLPATVPTGDARAGLEPRSIIGPSFPQPLPREIMADARPPIRLALLWHFHQPEYTDVETGIPALPWTRLHALKDYADMAEHLARHPGFRATFNLVPTLLDQLRALADRDARPDPFLALARRPVGSLSPDDRRFVVSHFFSFNRDTLARGLWRMQELAALRGDYPLDELPKVVVDKFDESALRDLQVLFHLAWCGPLLSADPRVQALRKKGHHFTEEEKTSLLDLQQEFLTEVLPRWSRLHGAGHVEFSCTPYYHPILPLLCDLASANEALPGMKIPSTPFAHPEDARLHLAVGIQAFEAFFGKAPDGGWPSEGAISEAALGLLNEAGYRWAASDEEVLFNSLGERFPSERGAAEVRRGTTLYRPWRFGDGPVLLFRDHDLSDRIGFVYSGWNPKRAAEDFVRRLLHLHEILPPEQGPYTVPVILDGENAWEYYPDHGAPFLEALYAAVAAEPRIRTVTFSEAADPAEAKPLSRVVAGSWIAHNLATWIGHPEKNRAWEHLAHAREAVAGARGGPNLDEPAWRAILAAEGSDWFWWFGDDHPTAYAPEFDASFRRHLRTAYRAAGLEPPTALGEPIRGKAQPVFAPPTGAIEPELDGRISHYFEWLPAGRADAASGAMQSAARLVREVRFGTDGTSVFLLIEPLDPPARNSLGGSLLVVRVPGDPDKTLKLPLPESGAATAGSVRMAVDRVVEVAIPIEAVAAAEGGVRIQLELESRDGTVQRVPAEGSLQLPDPDNDPARFDWFV
jgi:alpha-amylase/alpha-mannosidase (GH57 family)